MRKPALQDKLRHILAAIANNTASDGAATGQSEPLPRRQDKAQPTSSTHLRDLLGDLSDGEDVSDNETLDDSTSELTDAVSAEPRIHPIFGSLGASDEEDQAGGGLSLEKSYFLLFVVVAYSRHTRAGMRRIQHGTHLVTPGP